MARLLAVLALAIAGCAAAGRGPAARPPLGDEGAVHLFLAPLPHESGRLTFHVTSVAALAESGATVPLEVLLPAVDAAELLRDGRWLAGGRLPPGSYTALEVSVTGARLAGEGGPADLLTGPEPVRIEVPFEVRRGQALVLSLAFDAEASLQDGFRLIPTFRGEVPPRTAPERLGACSLPNEAAVALLDARSREVTAVVATGRRPAGVALDPAANRAWVALEGQDEVQEIDLQRAEPVRRLPLRAGDGPRRLLLLPDRRTLLVVNGGSRTAAFLDTAAAQEVTRAPLGEDPWNVLPLPGNRALVVNRRGPSLTLLDLAARQAIATVTTDPEPLQAAVSRDGRRLYVVHAGSIHLTAYELPGLAPAGRIRVGLGASAVKVDARTDLLYVASAHDGRIQAFDAASALPLDAFDVPAGVSQLLVDDQQDQLLAVMPARRAIAVVDLTNRRLRAVLELPGAPDELHLAAERR